MQTNSSSNKLLPENAYRKLNPGETYVPIVGPNDLRPELTAWAVSLALILVGLFSAAAVYVALRAGSGIETAIPIVVLAVFFGRLKKTKSTILENVIVQSIGQASGVVAAGAAFTIPALYLNALQPKPWQIFLACLIGGFLGIVLIIPLRRYFVSDRHGDLPFPEATATTEILVTGEQTGKSAGRVLILAFALGGLYDFFVEAVHAWNPLISTKTVLGNLGEKMYAFRSEIRFNAIALLFGLGYIIGPRYASLIAAGSVLAYLIMVPFIYLVGSQVTDLSFLGKNIDVQAMGAGEIFNVFVKPIGIGAIAVSGFIGVIRMGRIIGQSVTLGFKGLKKTAEETQAALIRTDHDMKPRNVMIIQLLSALAMGVLFFLITLTYVGPDGQSYTFSESLLFSFVGMVVAFALSFLFTPVAAEAIAIVGINPVSGMTMITLILGSLIMVAVGLSGSAGTFIAIIIGCAVCTALSVSGALVSDFKIGYWIGSTPRYQQVYKFLGIAVAALVVAVVVPVMDSAYHFLVPIDPSNPASLLTSNTDALPAPQANMLAAIVKGMMTDVGQPFLLYALGGLIALMLLMAGVAPLPFSLGMYLPIHITLAQLFGAIVSWIVGKSGKDEEDKKARAGQGVLIASGMMAGAAIFGILAALLRVDWTEMLPFDWEWLRYPLRYVSIGVDFVVAKSATGVTYLAHATDDASHYFDGRLGQTVGFLMFVLLGVACFLLARWGAKKEMEERKEQK